MAKVSVSKIMTYKSQSQYYRGIYSAKHLQILQNVGWFSVSISSGNVQIFVLNVTFTRYMMKVSCGNTEFKHQNQNKTFQDSQGRAALFASPFLQNLKCKFPQNFLILIGISPKLRWVFGFFIAWPLRICVFTTFRILSHVILMTWRPESGFAKYFFAESVTLW